MVKAMSLTRRGLERDSQVAGQFFPIGFGHKGRRVTYGKREDVRRFVLTPECLVQSSQRGVVRKQNMHFTPNPYSLPGSCDKACDGRSGNARRAGFSK